MKHSIPTGVVIFAGALAGLLVVALVLFTMSYFFPTFANAAKGITASLAIIYILSLYVFYLTAWTEKGFDKTLHITSGYDAFIAGIFAPLDALLLLV